MVVDSLKNPLEPDLAKAAGDCLDEKQCKQCATRVRSWGMRQENMILLKEEANAN